MAAKTKSDEKRSYTSTKRDEVEDEFGERPVKPSVAKAEIKKGVNEKLLPNSVGMTRAKPGNDEAAVFKSVHDLLDEMSKSHDVATHDFSNRGINVGKQAKPEVKAKAPAKKSK